MARTGQREVLESTSSNQPVTTPAIYQTSDYNSHIFQSVLEMQKTLGQLTQSVVTLTDESKKNTEKIDAIGKQVYAAKVVITIVGSIVGGIYVLCEIWKVISPFILSKPHP